HQLTGLYSLGATCSNQTGQGYATSYDQWGNVTGRTYSGTTGTLTYDILDHLTQWYVSSSNQEQYLYDASGNRVLRRSTNNTGTTLIVYPFGLEEHQYSGSGTNQWNTYYYFLGSRLIGDLDANNTYFLLTDALGSILSEISWSAGGASVQGNQLFGPYGNGRYSAGSINTAKGFIGQYNDGLTGFDYFHARYYDPVAGVFLSADKVQGNWQGMNPYGYVDGNPETRSDPTGKMIEGQNGEYGNIDSQGNLHIWVPYPSYGSGQGYIYRTYFYTHAQLQQPAQDTSGPSSWQKLMDALGITDIENTFTDPNATFWDKFGAVAGAVLNDANNLLLAGSILFGGPELAGTEERQVGGAEILTEGGEEALIQGGEEALAQSEEEVLLVLEKCFKGILRPVIITAFHPGSICFHSSSCPRIFAPAL
ncbi:MAG TPA: RHS repeat-associated core domain-containing protein, partial [Ktedonobacteraceae bacterium]|nr:RHS repeat-associated core domain-containing protein [Ktedonobacteraceae bacterium]